MLLYVDPPRVIDDQLYTQWNGTNIKRSEVATHIRKFLGLEREKNARDVSTHVGAVRVDERLVQHPLDLAHKERFDADHLRFGPLILPTLVDPDEINEMPARKADHEKNPRVASYHFLRLYRLGNRVITHLVIVHQAEGYAITSYRYDEETDVARLDKERRTGIVKYSRLAILSQKKIRS